MEELAVERASLISVAYAGEGRDSWANDEKVLAQNASGRESLRKHCGDTPVNTSAGQKYDTEKYILNIFKYIRIRYGPRASD
jgi:hypothetical protein